MRHIDNALLILYRPTDHLEAGQMLVQDRRVYRPPPWGSYSSGIKAGETSLQSI